MGGVLAGLMILLSLLQTADVKHMRLRKSSTRCSLECQPSNLNSKPYKPELTEPWVEGLLRIRPNGSGFRF